MPFHSKTLFATFSYTQFILKQIDVDVEGTLEKKNGTLVLHASPADSLFFIDNREHLNLPNGSPTQRIRLKGYVTNRQGCNMLTVTKVLSPIITVEEIAPPAK